MAVWVLVMEHEASRRVCAAALSVRWFYRKKGWESFDGRGGEGGATERRRRRIAGTGGGAAQGDIRTLTPVAGVETLDFTPAAPLRCHTWWGAAAGARPRRPLLPLRFSRFLFPFPPSSRPFSSPDYLFPFSAFMI